MQDFIFVDVCLFRSRITEKEKGCPSSGDRSKYHKSLYNKMQQDLDYCNVNSNSFCFLFLVANIVPSSTARSP